jgi:replicative DNA helicase
LRAGYPDGVPPTDYFPVLALLSRRLSTDEVTAVAQELMRQGEIDHIDIGVAITQLTDNLPTPADIERVRERLAAKGWPLDDPRDSEDAG